MVKPIPTACLLILTLLCVSSLQAGLNSCLRHSPRRGFATRAFDFASFHSGSVHERWSTLQGAELHMNAVFFDIILTPPKAGIVQISPRKELSHNIRRLSL